MDTYYNIPCYPDNTNNNYYYLMTYSSDLGVREALVAY